MIEPHSTVSARRQARWTSIQGWTLTVLPALILAASASGRLVGAVELACALLGVVAWRGLFLRDERLRALLPFRK